MHCSMSLAMFRFMFLVCVISAGPSSLNRLYFNNCNSVGWKCVNNMPNDVIFSCRNANQYDVAVHLKDFHTGSIRNFTVEHCNNIKLYTDCPQLAFSSYLQQFSAKDSGKLEFSLVSELSYKQTPSSFIIENVRQVASIPRHTFKSPSNVLEMKCFGAESMQSVVIRNSNINKLENLAIHNVSGMRRIEFQNVSFTTIEENSIVAVMSSDDSEFIIKDCKIDKVKNSSINVNTGKFIFTSNTVGTIIANGFNVTSLGINFANNKIKEIQENGLSLSSEAMNISHNVFEKLQYRAMVNSKCLNRQSPKYFYFINNTVEKFEQYSLHFNIDSCLSILTPVRIRQNTIEDCLCEKIAWLTAIDQQYSGIYNMLLDKDNNNTCYPAPCLLPVEVVRTMQSNKMCHLNLAPQVMCYVYYDRRVNGRIGSVISNDVDADPSANDDAAEPTAAFYLIRQAPESDAHADFIDKDEIMNDNKMNMTNRTTIRMVFDASRNFEETLRHTNATNHHRTRLAGSATVASAAPRRPLVHQTNCAGSTCNNSVSVNKQKALDFYKYLYAQLHNDSTKP